MRGVIESPNYPVGSSVAKNCTYVVTVPIGYIVKLTVQNLDIEFDHRCLFDFVQIENERYCGKLAPPPIYSMNNEMRIIYVNDDSKISRGFRAKFEAIELGCGGVLKQGDPVMSISPANIKEFMPVNQCLWEIRANQSSIVMVKFYHTQDEPIDESQNVLKVVYNDAKCEYLTNYMLINDSDGSLIKKFCINQLPAQITSTGRKLFLTYVFRTDETTESTVIANSTWSTNATTSNPVQNDGRRFFHNFYANYFFIPRRKYCDRNLFTDSGKIRSPGFPRRYLPNLNCTFIIHVDNGLQIRLVSTKFQLEPIGELNGKCFDYLEIRNGRRSDSPLIGNFCGEDKLPEIVSHSNYLFLRFISDASMQNVGFELRYETVSTGCGGLLTSESGNIESPDYPNNYYSNSNCEWKIRVAEGSSITLTIMDINIEESVNHECRNDYMEIFDGPDDKFPSLGRLCDDMSKLKKNVLTSTSNTLFIRFVTDAVINHGGFRLNYRTQCNKTLSGNFGVIESPVS